LAWIRVDTINESVVGRSGEDIMGHSATAAFFGILAGKADDYTIANFLLYQVVPTSN
jgi:hypothetical protein